MRGSAAPAGRIVRTSRCYLVRGRTAAWSWAPPSRSRDSTPRSRPTVFRPLEAAWEVLPEVGELRAARGSAGLRPGTPDNMALVGPGALEGLVGHRPLAQRGALAPYTGEAVAAILTGGAPTGRARPVREGAAGMTGATINGEPRKLPAGATVDAAVRAAGVPDEGRGVAVALDGEVVPRGAWSHRARRGAAGRGLHAVQEARCSRSPALATRA